MIRNTTILVAAALLAWSAAAVHAQGVYRIVGPDGRVTFTDRPPQAGGAAMPAGGAASGAAEGNAALPYTLRQTAARYPVVLYTSADCAPCVNGRNLLVNRGIPFTERTVSSRDDIDALTRLAGDTGLPLLTLGRQQLKGFSDTEWTQYLDAAGYPRQSQLPADYQRPPAAPMVAAGQGAAPAPGSAPAQPEAARPEAARAAPAKPAARGAASPSNPAGIVF